MIEKSKNPQIYHMHTLWREVRIIVFMTPFCTHNIHIYSYLGIEDGQMMCIVLPTWNVSRMTLLPPLRGPHADVTRHPHPPQHPPGLLPPANRLRHVTTGPIPRKNRWIRTRPCPNKFWFHILVHFWKFLQIQSKPQVSIKYVLRGIPHMWLFWHMVTIQTKRCGRIFIEFHVWICMSYRTLKD